MKSCCWDCIFTVVKRPSVLAISCEHEHEFHIRDFFLSGISQYFSDIFCNSDKAVGKRMSANNFLLNWKRIQGILGVKYLSKKLFRFVEFVKLDYSNSPKWRQNGTKSIWGLLWPEVKLSCMTHYKPKYGASGHEGEVKIKVVNIKILVITNYRFPGKLYSSIEIWTLINAKCILSSPDLYRNVINQRFYIPEVKLMAKTCW